MSEQNKKVAVDYIAAMNNGDGAKAVGLLATDAKFVTKGFGQVSGSRSYDEMVPLLHMFKPLAPTGLNLTIKSATAEGERVALEIEGNAVLCNGAAYCNQYVMVFTIQGGKIKQMNEYLCTKLADDVLMPAVAYMQKTAN